MKDGGPAFPIPAYATGGMSLRDYFAGQALACLHYHNVLINAYSDEEAALQLKNAAVLCYRMADLMLAQQRQPV